MKLEFCKMQGAGNDFVVIDNRIARLTPDQMPALARRVCARRTSVGADGLMVADEPERGGDAKMWFFNSDGSVGEMCGNGARCFGRFVYEHFTPKDEIVIEATSGNVPAWRQTDRLYKVLLNRPTVLRTGWPTQDADGGPLRAAYVELGDPGLPHLVVPTPGLAGMEDYAQRLFETGRALRFHPLLPKGANVNFCQVLGPREVLIRTYERGVEDFTLACGTGSGSTVAALQAMGLVAKGEPVTVHNPGDDLVIDCRWAGDTVEQLFLTGPTNLVAVGVITDEDLQL